MFTQGLDSNALKWVGEEKKKDISVLIPTQGLQCDPIASLRNGGRGFGLPPSDKFRSGYMPSGIIPVSRAIPRSGDDSGSGSDMDIGTDSEDDIHIGQDSLDSSPQDNRIPVSAGPKYPTPLQKHRCTEDVERMGDGGGGFSVGRHGCTEDGTSDSAAGSGVSSTQFRSLGGVMPHRAMNASESNVSLRTDTEMAAEQDFYARGMQKLSGDDDIPSAPPFVGSSLEINQDRDQISSSTVTINEPNTTKNIPSSTTAQENSGNRIPDPSASIAETTASLGSLPARLPTFHASGQGPWCAVISYDACVRLCLHSWAGGCMEAPLFLDNECALLRNAFGLEQVLLQSEEELLARRSSDIVSEGVAPKPKKIIGKMKVQTRKVKMARDPPTGCSFTSLKQPTINMESFWFRFSKLKSTLHSGWVAVRKVNFAPRIPVNGSFSSRSLAYMHASTRYIKQVSGLLKIGVTSMCNNGSPSYEAVQETYSCLLRLKSSSEEDAVRMQAGSGETHVFFPDSIGDDLIIEVQDSKGQYYGRVVAQLAAITDEPSDKLRWWSIYHEPEHDLVGRIQLYINYSTIVDENSHLKCGSVAETVAYDLVLEVAMKVQRFQQRHLLLHGPWKWLVTEFASYYGVSDAYTKLRYLSYVMEVATPTADCLGLVHDLLLPVLMKCSSRGVLSHQENRILGEIEDQVEQILALVFENYKSLDESSPSGMLDVFVPAIGNAAPALEPAVKLYTLFHDILSSEAQLKLCKYFQAAAKKRSRRHLAETDDFISSNNESTLMDSVTLCTAYQKMKSLCLNIRNEIFADIEIHNQHVLPSFIDLPNLSSAIYSVELCNRLQAFLLSCPPSGPSPPVTELVIATADFQKDIACWNISPIKGGVDAKELFHLYIIVWIQDKRLALLDSCKLDKVKWCGIRTQHSTTPFVDEMYERLKETLNEYEIIIRRWPEYTIVLENAVADVEKAVLEALEKQYADVLSPLKDNLATKILGLKYVQKFAKRTVNTYTVPGELGILLNSMKRMLDVLRPKIETQLKSWGSCIPDGGNAVAGERLSEVTVMLRAKFRNYVQAIVEKLAENTRVQSATKLKKIIQDSEETVVESDVQSRMQPLKDLLTKTIDHLYTVFEVHVFIAICRCYWDRMGQDVLSFLENRRENQSWYKGSRIAVSILDDTFASQMQQLLGNALQEKDLEPPRSIMEVRSMLCKDAVNHKENNYYF